jgi:hypothetical protein
VLVFPPELRVEDPTVNDFVTRAMSVCAVGDYDAFRLLWSPKEDPIPRGDFEHGWDAVTEIRIRALEKALLAPDPSTPLSEAPTVFVLAATVTLDPKHKAGRREPQREVVLMTIREQDEWRLARAPKAMRDWIREKIGPNSGDAPSPTPPKTERKP